MKTATKKHKIFDMRSTYGVGPTVSDFVIKNFQFYDPDKFPRQKIRKSS